MRTTLLLAGLALFVGAAITVAQPPVSAKPASPQSAMLPARTLHCTLGRALNLDPDRFQTIADIKYEGSYRFSLFLPAIPANDGVLPDPSADPEPVHPATRILDDPAGLARDVRGPFNRVVDLWPHRVEMAVAIEPQRSRLIVVSEIDPAKGTANLFMTRAADAASLDLDNVYQGGCRIETKPVNG